MIRVNNLHDVPWREGLTVQDVLDHLKYSYALITVTLGNELVEPERYADTLVPDNCAMTVFHLAHGG
ncbi:MoaD/ThiS family protein [Myxococcota bacterium]|nr:MoaD/ThiS family protein [Myxococcota bacterium]